MFGKITVALSFLFLAAAIWLAVHLTPTSEDPDQVRARMEEIKRFAGEESAHAKLVVEVFN